MNRRLVITILALAMSSRYSFAAEQMAAFYQWGAAQCLKDGVSGIPFSPNLEDECALFRRRTDQEQMDEYRKTTDSFIVCKQEVEQAIKYASELKVLFGSVRSADNDRKIQDLKNNISGYGDDCEKGLLCELDLNLSLSLLKSIEKHLKITIEEKPVDLKRQIALYNKALFDAFNINTGMYPREKLPSDLVGKKKALFEVIATAFKGEIALL